MLLESFLSSGAPELTSDTKTLLNNTSIVSSQNPTGDAESFKNALNDSIIDRSKFHINQIDMVYSESNLVDNIQKWDHLYSGDEQLDASVDDTTNFNSNLRVLKIHQSDLTESVDLKTDFVSGEDVPVYGNPLPGASLLVSQKPAVADNKEILTNTENSVGSVVEQKKNEEPLAPVKDLETDNLPKSAQVVDKLATSHLIPEQKVKSSEQLTKDVIVEGKINIKDVIPNIAKEATEQKQTQVQKPSSNEALSQNSAVATSKIATTAIKSAEQKVKSSEQLTKDVTVEAKINIKDVIPNIGKEATEQKQTQVQKPSSNEALSQNSAVATSKIATTAIKSAEIKVGSSEFSISSSINSSISEQKSTSVLLNEEIKKAKTADIFTTKSKENNLTAKPLIMNQSKSNPVPFSDQGMPQSKESNATIVPEVHNNKIESTRQFEVQTQPLIADQFVQQIVKNDNPGTTSTSLDSTIQNAPQPIVSTFTGETISNPVQHQVNYNHNISRASEIAIPVSLPTNQWNKKFAEHVSMLTLKGASSAQIKLDPPELGPLAVRIHHSGSETQIQFHVSNPIARELVDSGMNKLREMLEEHGFENVNVDVSERQSNEQHAAEELSNSLGFDEKIDEMHTNSLELSENVQNNSLIDLFA